MTKQVKTRPVNIDEVFNGPNGQPFEDFGTIEDFRQLLDMVYPFIWVSDNAAHGLWYNAACNEYTGVEMTAITGWNWRNFIDPAYLEGFEADVKRHLASGEPYEGMMPFRGRDGKHRWFLVHGRAVKDERGIPQRWFLSGTDVNDIRERVEESFRAAHAAQQANAAKSLFLANMSHEIRTPMNTIVGLAALLADTDMPADQKDSVNAILRSGESLLYLLNDILDFSKMEAGQLPLEHIPFNLKASLQTVIDLQSPLASHKGITLIYEYAPGTPVNVVADPTRANQIALNLINNAIKFTEKGHVKFTVSAKPIENSSKHMFEFVIEDTGAGMSAETQANLFQSFNQGDPSTSRKHGGSGLGLAICKRLVELKKGTIHFTSEAGRGSTFVVRVPLNVLAGPDLPPTRIHSLQRDVRTRSFSKFRVLVVDDHPLNLMVAVKLLRKIGFEHVDEAVNGRLALEKMAQNSYDAVLLDCQMPEIDGYETTRKLRELEAATRAKRTTVIAMTANAMSGDRKVCLDAGMDDYISKPINPNMLLDRLGYWLFDRPNILASANVAAEPQRASANRSSDEGKNPVDISFVDLFTDGNAEAEKVMAETFIQFGEESLADMRRDMVTASAAETWRKHAHKFKGSAGQIGAEELARLCRLAEGMGEAGPDEKHKQLQEIQAEFDRVKQFFAGRRKEQAEKEKDDGNG